MGILEAAVKLGLDGSLGCREIARRFRKRRSYAHYLRALQPLLEEQDSQQLIEWLATNVLERKNMPRMRKALERAQRDGGLVAQ